MVFFIYSCDFDEFTGFIFVKRLIVIVAYSVQNSNLGFLAQVAVIYSTCLSHESHIHANLCLIVEKGSSCDTVFKHET